MKPNLSDRVISFIRKIKFNHHIEFFSSHAKKLQGLIRAVTFPFSTTDNLLMLYFALVTSKLKHVSVARNSVTIIDSNKLGRIKTKFTALCHNRFFNISSITMIIYWKN
jgi:hypothetical protein